MPLPSPSNLVRLARKHPRYLGHLMRKKMRLRGRYRWVRDNPGGERDVPPPLVYKVSLTRKCNLRCGMCMIWGELGWCSCGGSDAGEEIGLGSSRYILKEI